MDGSQPLDPRKTIFVGGVPRPLRAGTHCSTGHVGCAARFGEHWGKPAWQPGNTERGATVGDMNWPEVVLGEEGASLELCLVLCFVLQWSWRWSWTGSTEGFATPASTPTPSSSTPKELGGWHFPTSRATLLLSAPASSSCSTERLING